ncbi:unnamed protein product [Calicophoron daubneyi]|uniref:Dynein light chain n=1 Tax=Calicophoron daubneyi TaxID=300641 RepID=A0AAV2TWR8_CALDB
MAGDSRVAVIQSDMDTEDQNEAIRYAVYALDKFSSPMEAAGYLKHHFDKLLYPRWHCVMGRSFGSSFTYEAKTLVNFTFEGIEVLLFRFG